MELHVIHLFPHFTQNLSDAMRAIDNDYLIDLLHFSVIISNECSVHRYGKRRHLLYARFCTSPVQDWHSTYLCSALHQQIVDCIKMFDMFAFN